MLSDKCQKLKNQLLLQGFKEKFINYEVEGIMKNLNKLVYEALMGYRLKRHEFVNEYPLLSALTPRLVFVGFGKFLTEKKQIANNRKIGIEEMKSLANHIVVCLIANRKFIENMVKEEYA